ERAADRLPEVWEFTLPTEAQWERACRAQSETPFSFGDKAALAEYAWFADNALNRDEPYAHRAGQKRANPWGLHDMYGNVQEWCRDDCVKYLPGGRYPLVTAASALRVNRGGSWKSQASACESSVRHATSTGLAVEGLGFRVALTPVR